MMPNIKKTSLFLCTLVFLTACQSMNNKFDCEMTPEGVCASVSEVNKMIDRGQISRRTSTLQILAGNTSKVSGKEETAVTPSLGLTPYPFGTSSEKATADQPLRYAETVMRVWISPYEDTQGYYHQASEIFVVTTPGHWLGKPVKAVRD